MAYKRSDMVYQDYRWTATGDHDDPTITQGSDASGLNRTEGYEMLYFINACAKKWGWNENSIDDMQKLETAIRDIVPSSVRTPTKIRQWLETYFRG